MEGHLSRLGWSEEEKLGEDEGKFGSVLKGPERGAQWVVFKCSVEWGKREFSQDEKQEDQESGDAGDNFSVIFLCFSNSVFLSLMLLVHGHAVVTHISYLL